MTALGIPSLEVLGVSLDATAHVKLEAIKDYVAKHQAKGERVFAVQYARITTVKKFREEQKIKLRGTEFFAQGILSGQEGQVDDPSQGVYGITKDGYVISSPTDFPEGAPTFSLRA
jgi:hypothetical protein